ncbi:glycosyl hydrolase family 65 protein [Runella sp.]|jgi:hypothetical protein|uniref:glycosyl hydrolase family 65 protein n=1 Tax=Runella sp. TaxID=1960881 RepID=UPI002615C933|nr:glycosyl hydrolase family 65 protein [Runella sp.]
MPQKQWDWFCLDNLLYHEKNIIVLWDKTGKHYDKGKGMRVFADGKEVFRSKNLSVVKVKF